MKGEKEFNKLNENKNESILNIEEHEEEEEEVDNFYIGVGKFEEMIEKGKNNDK